MYSKKEYHRLKKELADEYDIEDLKSRGNPCKDYLKTLDSLTSDISFVAGDFNNFSPLDLDSDFNSISDE